MKLANKHIFVTGGAKGIGEAIVRDAATESAAVTFIDIDDNAGNKLATELTASGKKVAYFHVIFQVCCIFYGIQIRLS